MGPNLGQIVREREIPPLEEMRKIASKYDATPPQEQQEQDDDDEGQFKLSSALGRRRSADIDAARWRSKTTGKYKGFIFAEAGTPSIVQLNN